MLFMHTTRKKTVAERVHEYSHRLYMHALARRLTESADGITTGVSPGAQG
ncbi:Uncharacterized protein BN1183_CA_00080 [Pantoea ananatis]|nr:Uncharacterized protein BN1183_CA_00080 [Pantoea ananatis]